MLLYHFLSETRTEIRDFRPARKSCEFLKFMICPAGWFARLIKVCIIVNHSREVDCLRKDRRKRMICKIAAQVLLLMALPVQAAAVSGKTAQKVPFVVISENQVNIRRLASEESEIVGKIYPNGTGRVLKTSGDGSWVRIRSGGVTGYVSAGLVAVDKEAEALMDAAGYEVAQVSASQVYVYDEADTDSNVISIEAESTFLGVTDRDGGWVQVRTPYAVTGWVREEDVRISVAYSTAEKPEDEEKRIAQEENADMTAAEESALWEIAQEALMGTAETKVPLMEAEMAREEACEAFLSEGGTMEQAHRIEEEILGEACTESELFLFEETENDPQEEMPQTEEDLPEEETDGVTQEPEEPVPDTPAAAAYRQSVEAVASAKAAADEDEKGAEAKVAEAQNASVKAMAAERVAIEAARLAPRGAPGCEFVTNRDHTIFFEQSLGQELVNYACQYVGNPYVWGGESLTGGCDCSGFTMLVYARFGIELPHFAQSQAAYGDAVEADELEPGDLVFFERGNYIYHVAIYIGNDTIVHAANSASGICFSDINYSSSNKYYRRIFTG